MKLKISGIRGKVQACTAFNNTFKMILAQETGKVEAKPAVS
jgi:hypothetical protein